MERSRRRKAFKRRPTRKRRTMTVARVKKIAKNINPKFTLNNASVSPTTSGTITEAVLIPQGSTGAANDDSRIDEQVTLQYIFVRGSITHDDNTNFLRIIMFRWDKLVNPTVTNILTTAFFNAFYNLEQVRGQYTVLSDRTFTLSAEAGPIKVFKMFKKVNSKINYTGTGQTAGYKGRIFLLAISDSAVGGPAVNFQIRAKFND